MTQQQGIHSKLILVLALPQGYEAIFSQAAFLWMNSLDRWRSKTKKQNKQAFQMQVIEKDYKYSE